MILNQPCTLTLVQCNVKEDLCEYKLHIYIKQSEYVMFNQMCFYLLKLNHENVKC